MRVMAEVRARKRDRLAGIYRFAGRAATAGFELDRRDTPAAAEALNTTLPLERTVITSVKPAASKARFSSGILAFMGLTARRNAA